MNDGRVARAPQDEVDDVSARADFAVLMYPVIATSGPAAHGGTVNQLRAAGVPDAALLQYSPDLHVRPGMPPTLLVHASDDSSVPLQNSVLMFSALQAAQVPSELRVFEHGGHGFGMRGIAGKDVANPIGTIASLALLLRHSAKAEDQAVAVERAIAGALDAGCRTADIAAPGEPTLSCSAMGQAIAERI